VINDSANDGRVCCVKGGRRTASYVPVSVFRHVYSLGSVLYGDTADEVDSRALKTAGRGDQSADLSDS
jgi:hypothetical protein